MERCGSGLTPESTDSPGPLVKSKSNQFGSRADIVLGATGRPLCPVSAILKYMYIAVRGSQPGPFFVTASKSVLSKAQFVDRIRSILQLLGLPQHDYAGHSFRIGGATSAAAAGVEDSTIQIWVGGRVRHFCNIFLHQKNSWQLFLSYWLPPIHPNHCLFTPSHLYPNGLA